MRWLTKPWNAPVAGSAPVVPRIMLSTGAQVQELLLKLYRPAGVRTTSMDLQHKNGLSNLFYCYSNFEHGEIQWLPEE